MVRQSGSGGAGRSPRDDYRLCLLIYSTGSDAVRPLRLNFDLGRSLMMDGCISDPGPSQMMDGCKSDPGRSQMMDGCIPTQRKNTTVFQVIMTVNKI